MRIGTPASPRCIGPKTSRTELYLVDLDRLTNAAHLGEDDWIRRCAQNVILRRPWINQCAPSQTKTTSASRSPHNG